VVVPTPDPRSPPATAVPPHTAGKPAPPGSPTHPIPSPTRASISASALLAFRQRTEDGEKARREMHQPPCQPSRPRSPPRSPPWRAEVRASQGKGTRMRGPAGRRDCGSALPLNPRGPPTVSRGAVWPQGMRSQIPFQNLNPVLGSHCLFSQSHHFASFRSHQILNHIFYLRVTESHF
jgi:hypothetical protein